MSVVLINPPNLFKGNKPFIPEHVLPGGRRYGVWPPLGLLYLASVLEKEGIAVKLIDAISPPIGMNEIVDICRRNHPIIVGLSATTMQIRGAVQLAHKLREEFGKQSVIGLGGAHITVDPDFIYRFPVFDFGLVGEGEVTFPKLVKRIISGEEVKGIFNGECPTELDEVPFPARHLIDKSHYNKSACILVSRGCPFNCLFCCSKVMGHKVRHRSAKNVVDEIEDIIDDYHSFWFVDDAFSINRKNALELCNEIIRRGISITWTCQTRADLVDKSLLERMYKAGCRLIGFGVESGSERVRNAVIRKKISDKSLFQAFRLCKETGILAGCSLMLGFPSESKEEMYQTAEIGLRLEAYDIGIHLTEIMPGTDLFSQAVGEGIVRDDVFDSYARGELESWPIYVPKNVSLEEMLEIRRYAYMKFYVRPKFIFRRAIQDLGTWSQLLGDLSMAIQLLRRGSTPTEPSEWKLT